MFYFVENLQVVQRWAVQGSGQLQEAIVFKSPGLGFFLVVARLHWNLNSKSTS